MDERQWVLEAGCGGGKLCVPLARAGHEVTGMDREAHILQFARAHAASLPNLRVRQGDIIAQAWGGEYDVAILGANLLVNLVTDRDSKRAQKNLLEHAHAALRRGGRLFLDFDCPLDVAKWTPANCEWVCFEGTDDWGTFGRYVVVNGPLSNRSRTVTGSRRWEIAPASGAPFTVRAEKSCHFPTLEETCGWLYKVGFTVESLCGGYRGEAFDREHRRAVLWARKL